GVRRGRGGNARLAALFGGQHVPHGRDGMGLDDVPVGSDPGVVERMERVVEPSSGRRPARVFVDDVAPPWLVHRRDNRDPDRLLLGPVAKRVEEAPPGDRLVRHDEDVNLLLGAQPAGTSSCSCSSTFTFRAPFRGACRAPGTPSWCGPPTTGGTSSKLKYGGGEEPCHSSVLPRHGFASAFGPRAQLTIML